MTCQNLRHAGGGTAWQSVFHLHLVPRFEPTDLTPPWTEVEHPVESLKGLAGGSGPGAEGERQDGL
ncbi:hypothetical protein ACIBI9_65065 [Nonomuraea sp. NPDC050451]|uniref:hypothetical protein n=1 Tax=Nonomuraea sp. NPDC050451 TaxID=3364364 RepID=UPI0037BDE214